MDDYDYTNNIRVGNLNIEISKLENKNEQSEDKYVTFYNTSDECQIDAYKADLEMKLSDIEQELQEARRNREERLDKSTFYRDEKGYFHSENKSADFQEKGASNGYIKLENGGSISYSIDSAGNTNISSEQPLSKSMYELTDKFNKDTNVVKDLANSQKEYTARDAARSDKSDYRVTVQVHDELEVYNDLYAKKMRGDGLTKGEKKFMDEFPRNALAKGVLIKEISGKGAVISGTSNMYIGK